MFKNTRLKLTIWYMLILMFVSSCFSVVIYRLMSQEVNRLAQMQQFRMERRIISGVIVPMNGPLVSIPIYDPDLISDIRRRLIFILLSINAVIWIISSALAYLLAGKTLRPIQVMVQDQNRFISDASHELKTPLTSLKTAFEVFARDKNSTLSEAKVLIEESVTEVNKLQALSENLLQLAQYQAPNGHSKMEKVQLNKIITGSIKTITPMAKKKQITLSSELIDVNIQGNKYSLNDLMTILIDNAIKYTQELGTVQVLMTKTEKSVTVKVKDNGVGIVAKDLPHIFDRFYRTDSARSSQRKGGYGLGLAIARKIVEAHHGRIEVVSQLDKGTTFTVRFPLFVQPEKNKS